MRIIRKQYCLPGSHHSPWTTDSLKTHHLLDPEIEALNRYYRATIVLGLLPRLSTFCTQLCTHCNPADQKIVEWPAHAFRETHRERTTRPTNTVTKSNCGIRIGFSKINRYLTLDTCECKGGCIFLQQQLEGPHKQIDYWSRSLYDVEHAHDNTYNECLAVVWGVLLIRPYLEGAKLKIRADHDSMCWILELPDTAGKLSQWGPRLAEFEFFSEHRAGIKNPAADALSLLSINGESKIKLIYALPVFTIVPAEWSKRGGKKWWKSPQSKWGA